jgi:hypothetical protein
VCLMSYLQLYPLVSYLLLFLQNILQTYVEHYWIEATSLFTHWFVLISFVSRSFTVLKILISKYKLWAKCIIYSGYPLLLYIIYPITW